MSFFGLFRFSVLMLFIFVRFKRQHVASVRPLKNVFPVGLLLETHDLTLPRRPRRGFVAMDMGAFGLSFSGLLDGWKPMVVCCAVGHKAAKKRRALPFYTTSLMARPIRSRATSRSPSPPHNSAVPEDGI